MSVTDQIVELLTEEILNDENFLNSIVRNLEGDEDVEDIVKNWISEYLDDHLTDKVESIVKDIFAEKSEEIDDLKMEIEKLKELKPKPSFFKRFF